MKTAPIADPAAAGPAPDPAAPFQLLRQFACLASMKKTAPMAHQVRGDVALVEGKLMARWQSGSAWHYAELAGDTDLDFVPNPYEARDVNFIAAQVTIDPRAHIAGTLSGREGAWGNLDTDTPFDKEVKRFIAEWPHVAELLGVTAGVDGFRLFSPGPVKIATPLPRDPVAVHGIDWCRILRDHVAGEWGVFGHFEERTFDAAEVFTLGFRSEETQSRHAVMTGNGWVRSRHVLAEDLQRQFPPPPNGGRRLAVVDVFTALQTGVQGGNGTLMTFTYLTE